MTLPMLKSQINSSIEDMKFCFFQSASATASDRYIRWNNNNFNCVILNVDGSCIGSPIRAGFGGLIRNSVGLFMSGYSGFIPSSSDILQAELTAIYHGISISFDMGITDMVIYSDSLRYIKLITDNNSQFHLHVVLIQDIRDMLFQGNYSVHHTLREGTYCADYFAKLGASTDARIQIHSSPPEDLRPLLRNDASGTLFLRS